MTVFCHLSSTPSFLYPALGSGFAKITMLFLEKLLDAPVVQHVAVGVRFGAKFKVRNGHTTDDTSLSSHFL